MAEMVDYEECEKTFEDMMEAITGIFENKKEFSVSLKRLEKNLRYHITGNRKPWAYPIATVYTELCNSAGSKPNSRLAYALNWCWEIVEALLYDVDDFVDQDKTRGMKPSWWFYNDARPIIMNDVVLLSQSVFQLLRKYFSQQKCYMEIVHYFQDAIFKYMVGCSLGLQTTKKENPEMDRFSWDTYHAMNDCMMYNYLIGMFELPMILAGYPKECELHGRIQDIVHDMTAFWRAQDDLNGSFGKVKRNPGREREIRKGQCTWTVLRAKELASPQQWAVLKDAYGEEDTTHVDKVEKIFMDLGMMEVGRGHLSSIRKKVEEKIDELKRDGHQMENSMRFCFKLLCTYDDHLIA